MRGEENSINCFLRAFMMCDTNVTVLLTGV